MNKKREGQKSFCCFSINIAFCSTCSRMSQSYSPTTCNSPDTMWVWNDGASALTSHENLPDISGTTLFNTILLAFDDCTWWVDHDYKYTCPMSWTKKFMVATHGRGFWCICVCFLCATMGRKWEKAEN